MKNYSFLLIIFLLPFFYTDFSANELNVKHDIEAVTVYLNSAEIARKANVRIPYGKSDLVFQGISNRIMNQGMKIKISNDVKVYAVNIEENKNAWNESEQKELLDKTSKEITKESSLYGIELNTLYKELEYWETNMKMGGNNGASFAQLSEGAKFFSEKIKALEVKIYAVKEQLSELQIRKYELEIKVEEERVKAGKINQLIRVTVISDRESDCDVDLRYLVSNAIWKPYYSLRAKGKDEAIVLEYQAQIYNDTGNDWNNKPMTLAIMDPSEDVSKPAMDVWVLDQNGSYKSEGYLSDAKGKYDYDGKDAVSTSVIQVDDLSTRFVLMDKHLIPSDATPHLVDVTTYTKDAEYYTLSIPKAKDGAFLIARIEGWESLGLLDGPMNLYYNDTYQGVSQLDTRQVSDTLDISLGKENSYTITRRKLSSMSSEKLIGFNIKEVLTYEIIVKNNKNQEATIELRDQLPLSTDKNVEVKPLVISGAKVDALSGQLTWDIKLKANESKRIELKFSVKYPKSKRGLLKQNKKRIATPRYF